MKVSVTSNGRDVQQAIQSMVQEQLPFAVATALTATAKLAAQDVTKQLPNIFDHPTPFTQRAVGFTAATKSTQTATVFVKQVQAKYLQLEETGGTRTPDGVALVLPVDIRRNAYGNIPNKALQRLKTAGSVFVGKVDGIGGFWQRMANDKLKLLAVFKPEAEYKPKFDFRYRVNAVVEAQIVGQFRRAMAKAIASARR